MLYRLLAFLLRAFQGAHGGQFSDAGEEIHGLFPVLLLLEAVPGFRGLGDVFELLVFLLVELVVGEHVGGFDELDVLEVLD